MTFINADEWAEPNGSRPNSAAERNLQPTDFYILAIEEETSLVSRPLNINVFTHRFQIPDNGDDDIGRPYIMV